MRFTLKLTVIFTGMVCLVIALDGYLDLYRAEAEWRLEVEREAAALCRALESELHRQLTEGGPRPGWRPQSQFEYGDRFIRWLDIRTIPAPLLAELREVAGTPLTVHRRLAGGESLVIYFPVESALGVIGYFEVSQPLATLHGETRVRMYRTGRLILIILLVAGLACVIGFWLVGKPLQQLRAKTERTGQGDFSDPIKLSTHDEFADLAKAINAMCTKLEAAQQMTQQAAAQRVAAVEQLRHLDRLETVGRMASGVAHELGTPLNVVSGRAELIASGQLPAEQVTESAKTIKAEATRMAGIIRQLLDFARRGGVQRQVADLRSVVAEAIRLVVPIVKKNGVTVEFLEPSTPCPARVDSRQLQQVLTNLLVNASQAMPDGGQVTVSVATRMVHHMDGQSEEDASYYCVEVRDQGTGIAPEDLDHVFEPFFTTKDVGEGTGLGLSVSHGIVQDHDGWIEVESEVGRGSCFTVLLPAADATPAANDDSSDADSHNSYTDQTLGGDQRPAGGP